MIKRSTLAMVVAAMAVPLVIAACGGAAATDTPEPTPTIPLESQIFSSEVSFGTPQEPGSGVQTQTGLTVAEGVPSQTGTVVQYNTTQQVGISVTAVGQVEVAPDLAVLNAGVEARALTVESALADAAAAKDRVMRVLEDRGLATADIRTRFFNISPEYTYNERERKSEIIGYRVSNQVSAKIRDIASVGVIIDEVARAGGDLVRVQGISFTVEDTSALEIQARELAVEALIAKAQQFADLTGVTLGKPVFLSESGGFYPRDGFDVGRLEAAAAPASITNTTISPGELTVTITVQGNFSITD